MKRKSLWLKLLNYLENITTIRVKMSGMSSKFG